MSMSSDRLEKREHPRHPYRISCTFRVAGIEYCGFIANVSARGFFIQSNAQPDSGTEVFVTIRSEPAMEIMGQIVRRRERHPDLATIDLVGVAVQFGSAPEAYYQLVMDLEEKALPKS